MTQYRRAHVPGGTYFFTVNLADRRSALLVEHVDLLRGVYRSVAQAVPFDTLAIFILPEHLHAIWRLPSGDSDYSTRWQRIKAGFSRALPAAAGRSSSKRRKGEKGIWQRRFWEHQIRDDADLQRHVDYIHFNPVKHGWAEQALAWPYSSFHRYVRDGLLLPYWAGNVAARGGGFGEGGIGSGLVGQGLAGKRT